MKFSRILTVTLLLFCAADANAQNKILMMQPGDSIPGVLRVTKRDYYNKLDYYTTPAAPAALVKAIPLKVDYKRASNRALNQFQTQHIDYYSLDIRSLLYLTGDGFGEAVKVNEYDREQNVKESMKKILFGNKM